MNIEQILQQINIYAEEVVRELGPAETELFLQKLNELSQLPAETETEQQQLAVAIRQMIADQPKICELLELDSQKVQEMDLRPLLTVELHKEANQEKPGEAAPSKPPMVNTIRQLKENFERHLKVQDDNKTTADN
jgi:hypothetical protein